MSDSQLSDVLQALISRHMPTLDHVAVLLALRSVPDEARESSELARQTRLDRDVAERVLRDLVSSRLVRGDGEVYRYAAAPEVRGVVDELAEMYRSKPVTLVRALYDRPTRAAQSFADAFRLRKPGD